MSSRAWLIACSLAINAACLAAFAFRPSLAPAMLRPLLPEASKAGSAPALKSAAVARLPARNLLWPALHAGDDLKTLIARLRAAGFPADIVRAIVFAEISSRYDTKMRAIFEPDPTAPFWKLGSNFYGSNDKKMEEYGALQRERTKLQRALLDDPFFASDDVTATQRRQFGNLSRQKIDALQRIEDDYSEMTAAIRSGTNGVMLREDRDKLELLQRERRADLAAVLSGAELADYEMRSSPISSMLSRQLGSFDPSEAEFRAIFQAQQGYNERIGPTAMTGGNMSDRHAAYRELNEQLKSTLGEPRFSEYIRETDRNYQQLTRLAERDHIPKEVALRAYNVRDDVSVESNRIANDTTLSTDQKREALRTLADQTRTKILSILGPSAGPPYVKVVEQQYLSMMQRGNAVSFDSVSGSMSMTMGGGGSMGLPVVIALGSSPTFRPVAAPPSPRPKG